MRMRAKLRRVGNSIGLTIPASELRAIEAQNGDIVEFELKRVVRSLRAGWNDPGTWPGAPNETMLINVVPANDFDDKDWLW